MKRVKRNPMRFETLDLFGRFHRDLSRDWNDPAVIDEFFSEYRTALQGRLKEDLHGALNEPMFENVVARLGHVKLIKKEDTGGDFFHAHSFSEGLQLPDYRILLPDDRQILVEVKN